MNGSDGDLVSAVRNGRREAYDELVRRHAAKIGAVCRSRIGARGPVEDMVQEAFLRAYRGLASLDEPDKFGSWLYGIAIRACLDWLKAKERGQLSFDALGDPDGLRRTGPVEEPDRNARLHDQIDALPEPYREVVLLFYYRKQSYQEMSRLLNLSPAAINARLTKARAMLRERMAGAL
ncbi:MAG TPA: sigma-70 family RNA polymerase sigma factor [Planctomycetota bacterium]|nr:sigma-70 family RNA polymerase sigma factor [Planctomycetota bacterium]